MSLRKYTVPPGSSGAVNPIYKSFKPPRQSEVGRVLMQVSRELTLRQLAPDGSHLMEYMHDMASSSAAPLRSHGNQDGPDVDDFDDENSEIDAPARSELSLYGLEAQEDAAKESDHKSASDEESEEEEEDGEKIDFWAWAATLIGAHVFPAAPEFIQTQDQLPAPMQCLYSKKTAKKTDGKGSGVYGIRPIKYPYSYSFRVGLMYQGKEYPRKLFQSLRQAAIYRLSLSLESGALCNGVGSSLALETDEEADRIIAAEGLHLPQGHGQNKYVGIKHGNGHARPFIATYYIGQATKSKKIGQFATAKYAAAMLARYKKANE